MNISLIGMMGSGKSTIGKLLAGETDGFSFKDTDDEIIKREKKTVNEIFETQGEKAFRDVESAILKDILKFDNQIISTGGGIILREDNFNLLKEKSIVIYLSASKETLFERIKNNKERPLLNKGNMELKIENILTQREPIYKKAHIIISTDNKTPEDITKEIIKEIERYERTSS